MKCDHLGERVGGVGCCTGTVAVHLCNSEEQGCTYCTPSNTVGLKNVTGNVTMHDGSVQKLESAACDYCPFATKDADEPPPTPASTTRELWLAIRNS